MYGPKSELHCDLSQEAALKLRQLLSPYRKNCPVEKSPNSHDFGYGSDCSPVRYST